MSDDPGPTRFRVGAYGLLIEDGQVLITRTRTRAGEIINLPGGALELGDGALDALRRELAEETGLAVEPLGLAYASGRYHRSAAYPESQLVKLYWFIRRTGGALNLAGNGDDIVGCFWQPLARVLELQLTPSDREMAEALRRAGAW